MADGYGVGKSMRDVDLEEEVVWGVLKEREDSSPKKGKSSKDSSVRRLPTAPRVIPFRSSSTSTSEAKMAQQSSAPLNIPDWSKIYRKSTAKKGDDVYGDYYDVVDDDDDADDDEMVPPHEYIARKLARSQVSSFSMCEGIGRTLKGRDLSKVRNAVLTKTGFLEE